MPPSSDPSQLEIRLAKATRTPKGYRQTYALRGPPEATLVQYVETEVDFGPADAPLVSYRGRYGEYFLLDASGQALDDLHEFDVQRDGWEQAKIRDTLKRAGVRGADGRPLRFTTAPLLHVRKRFALSLGEVEDVRAALGGPQGAAFGFLSEGPRGPAAAELIYSPPGGRRRTEPAHAVAAGHQAHGRGRFTARSGWTVVETYRYDFATLTRAFDDGGGYRLTEL
jgi:hypothetical protein